MRWFGGVQCRDSERIRRRMLKLELAGKRLRRFMDELKKTKNLGVCVWEEDEQRSFTYTVLILSLYSRQLACEVWRHQRQKRLGLGAGLRSWGARDWYVALHSRKEDKWGLASQLAKPDSPMPFSLPSSSACVYQKYSFHFSQSVKTVSSVTLAQHHDGPGCDQSAYLYSVNSGMSYACT